METDSWSLNVSPAWSALTWGLGPSTQETQRFPGIFPGLPKGISPPEGQGEAFWGWQGVSGSIDKGQRKRPVRSEASVEAVSELSVVSQSFEPQRPLSLGSTT